MNQPKTKQKQKPEIIVILGPTASNKSFVAVELARKLNGEIISADSRQVYKGLDIGSGKITQKEMRGVAHHLIDVASLRTRFTVDAFQKQAYLAIDDIIARNKIPIVCGGTGFYIQALVDGICLPEVSEDKKLRENLKKLSTEELQTLLIKLDKKRAKNIDLHNRVRLIRAIEIATHLGSVPKLTRKPKYNALQIGIHYEESLLKQRITKRLKKRIDTGMIDEVVKLHAQGVSYKKLKELGLEYRYIAEYLQGKFDKETMIELLNIAINQYAKRQINWFKKRLTNYLG